MGEEETTRVQTNDLADAMTQDTSATPNVVGGDGVPNVRIF
jgi:hypothetical protein